MQYCLARALVNHQVILGHFEGDAYCDAEVQRVMKLVHAAAFSRPAPGENDDFDAEIRITAVDGNTFTGSINRPVGHGPGIPVPAGLLKEKFERCAGRGLPLDQASQVYAMVQEFDKLLTINDFTAGLLIPTSRRGIARTMR